MPLQSDDAGLANALRWRSDRSIAVSADDAEVWSFGGAGPVRLAGRGAGALARAIDGTATAAGVVDAAVAEGMAAPDAERILAKWQAKGHVCDVESEEGRQSVVLRAIAEPGDERSARADAEDLAGVLSAMGVEVLDDVDGLAEGLLVLVVPDLLALLPSWQEPEPCVAVQVRGERAFVVGVLDGTRGRCPACLDARLRLRRTPDVVAAGRVGRRWPPTSPLRHPASIALAAGVVASIASAPVQGADTALLVLDPASGQVAPHVIAPVAGCPICDPGGPTVTATHLRSARGSVVAAQPQHDGSKVLGEQGGGGFRVVDPDVTWSRYSRLISDAVGIVPYVRQAGPTELRAFVAGANAAAADDLVMLRSRLRSASGGKGISLAAARTGALAEALERHSLRATGGEPHVRGRRDELPGPAVLPNEVQLFSQAQLHRTEQLLALGIDESADGKGFHRVPRRFDPELVHDWSPVADWHTGETVFLPSSMVWFGWPGAPYGYPSGSSNGAAAGNTVDEALLQGVLELVERDSVALWWHPRCRRPAFDLEAWDDPRIDAALATQRSLGSDVWVLDLTTDLGIPAAVAVASGWTTHTRAPLMGFGAHVDPALAVVRALTELAQMQAPVIASQGEIMRAEMGTPEAAWFSEVTVESEPWLAPHGVAQTPATPEYASVQDALADVAARVAGSGMRLLWADCTRPDVGLPVVRTWAPGLRHFWNRYASGRLYDVPPALGWSPPGYTEADLNPRPMIL